MLYGKCLDEIRSGRMGDSCADLLVAATTSYPDEATRLLVEPLIHRAIAVLMLGLQDRGMAPAEALVLHAEPGYIRALDLPWFARAYGRRLTRTLSPRWSEEERPEKALEAAVELINDVRARVRARELTMV